MSLGGDQSQGFLANTKHVVLRRRRREARPQVPGKLQLMFALAFGDVAHDPELISAMKYPPLVQHWRRHPPVSVMVSHEQIETLTRSPSLHIDIRQLPPRKGRYSFGLIAL